MGLASGTGKRVIGRATLGELEPAVQDNLRLCESKIEGALSDAWHALRKIHDDKLYKADRYNTFEEYAEKRWGYSKSRAYQLIDHANIIDRLKAEGVAFLPSGEGLTRPLQKMKRSSKSEDDFQQKVSVGWRAACDSAPKVMDVPQVTVQHVESTMERLGLYRNAKRSNPTAAATALRDLLTKIGQSDALKETPEDFYDEYELKGLPSNAARTVGWLVAYLDRAGIRD